MAQDQAVAFTEVARVVLSGASERRRGYLTTTITTWNQLAISGTIALWGFMLKWETVLGQGQSQDWELFAIQAAWAGALSSLLIGFWRYYAHFLDYGIVRLYPTLYICERALLPAQVCTLDPPNPDPRKPLDVITRSDIAGAIDYREVHVKDFRGRGHGVIDAIGGACVVLFGVASVWLGVRSGRVTLLGTGTLHIIGWLLLFGNGMGLVLLVRGSLKFRNRPILWPVPVWVSANERARRSNNAMEPSAEPLS